MLSYGRVEWSCSKTLKSHHRLTTYQSMRTGLLGSCMGIMIVCFFYRSWNSRVCMEQRLRVDRDVIENAIMDTDILYTDKKMSFENYSDTCGRSPEADDCIEFRFQCLSWTKMECQFLVSHLNPLRGSSFSLEPLTLSYLLVLEMSDCTQQNFFFGLAFE